MNIAAQLHKSAVTNGEKPAVCLGKSVAFTYRELAERVGRLAGALNRHYGIEPGERVALFTKNAPDYLTILYAIWHAGAVAVPINAKLHPRECRFILKDCGARLCFVDDKHVDRDLEENGTRLVCIDDPSFHGLLDHSPVPLTRCEPTDLAWLFYTSGTTGQPKGVMLTHRNLMAMIMNFYADMQAISHHDSILHFAPMSHGSGCYALPYIAKGARNVITESGAFDLDEALDLIGQYPDCSMFLAPTMITRLMNHPGADRRSTENLRSIFYGGGPMYREDLLRALEIFGPKFIQLYGQGEAPMTITSLSRDMHIDVGHPRYLQRLASAGIPRTDVEVRVVDVDGHDMPVGEQGEIVVAGDVVMAGYWNNPEATADTIRDGWLYTGDVGRFDEDGFLTLLDRSKDMIISGGTNIYPREIEDLLLMDPAVAECSVIGRPHPDWGEEVVAFVVARPNHTIDTTVLDRLCLDNIARFKRPKTYIELPQLPKNNYGKVLKTALRECLGGELSR